MSKNDDGLAFPFFDERVMNTPEWGMSMRDYFAAKAMQSATMELGGIPEDQGERMIPIIAKVSYKIADAMLAERAK